MIDWDFVWLGTWEGSSVYFLVSYCLPVVRLVSVVSVVSVVPVGRFFCGSASSVVPMMTGSRVVPFSQVGARQLYFWSFFCRLWSLVVSR
jgi:hypothetical protein